jgi:hypothetical protein
MLYRVTSLAYDPAGTLFYTTDNYALRDLVSIDVSTGEEKMLLEDARIGEVVLNRADRSLLGVRHQNGLATLVRIPPPYKEWNQVHTFPYGVVPYDLDISPDGRLLSASVAEVNGDQFLRVWELAKVRAGDLKPLSEHSFGQSVPEGFVFSRDGRYLYGSSYYTGVSNIFRYEVANGEVEAVTNAGPGYFRPAPLADGRLAVFTYTGQGFVPTIIEPKPIKDVSAISFLGAEVAAKHPVVTTWQVPPPGDVDYDKLVTGKGVYVPLRNLEVRSGYPVLQGYKNSAGIGYHLEIEDALRIASLGITAAWTPDDDLLAEERGHFEAKYRYLGWKAAVSWNRSDFYDLFGPTIRSRKGYAAKLGYDHSIIFDGPRKFDLKGDIAFYDKIDALPDYQNVDASFDRLVTGQVGLFYSHMRKSLGAVDEEKGFAWQAVLSANHVNGKTIPQLRGAFDYGWALPIDHSSVWLRTAAGVADGDRRDPFANFFFGGFGNNYVDNGEVKRYREHYALPGFEINEVGGRSFVRQMAEWNLPPVVFETLGTPSFHLTWLRPAVFATGLWTDPHDSERRKGYASTGLQVDLRFSVLHWYDVTLSAGYAVGFSGGRRGGDEWMISLKIM